MSLPNRARTRAAPLTLILLMPMVITWFWLAPQRATGDPIAPQLTATPRPTTAPTIVIDRICDLLPDNCAFLPIVWRDDQPDLVVAWISISLNMSCPPGSLGLRVTIANVGNAAAGPFVVEANSAQQPVSGGLAAGQSTTLWYSVYSASAPNTATADATRLITEADETNNQISRMLPLPTLMSCPPPTLTPS